MILFLESLVVQKEENNFRPYLENQMESERKILLETNEISITNNRVRREIYILNLTILNI